MTHEEADALVALLRSAAPAQELDDARVQAMAEVLAPLAFGPARRRVEAWAVADHGEEKWMSTPDDVLRAVGVGPAARKLVHRALTEGGEVWPSLREEGWEYVAPDAPLPRGVGEWHLNLGLPVPSGREVTLALPAGPSEEMAEERVAATTVAAIGRDLAQRKAAQLRRSFVLLREPAESALPDRLSWPPALREAVEAAEVARDRATQAERRCLAQERVYREMCAEMAENIRDAAPDYESARAVSVELLRRVEREGGVGAVLELVRDALNPALAIAACEVKRGPSEDPFDDAPGPIEAVRVVIRREKA